MAHHQEQHILVLFASLLDNLVHLLAWLRPCCPEVEDRDLVQVLGKDLLELLGRVDSDEVT